MRQLHNLYYAARKKLAFAFLSALNTYNYAHYEYLQSEIKKIRLEVFFPYGLVLATNSYTTKIIPN